MWAYGPENFAEFDDSVTEMLRRGLQLELLRRTLSVPHAAAAARSLTKKGAGRSFSRTESLVAAIAHRDFGTKLMGEVTHPELDTVISATDLSTANAVRFGSRVSASSPYGRIVDTVPVADAVAASAAFPALLPALVRDYTFETFSTGTQSKRRLSMTDGGVYDNLGITPLLPGRSPKHTSHVYDLNYIVSVDSGRGREASKPAQFMLNRLKQTLMISHGRVQDSGRSLLNAAAGNGLAGFVHVYLGMRDHLVQPLADLVPGEVARACGTDFKAMADGMFQAVTIRGEQLTRLVVEQHASTLR
jgi:NTE family protein